MHIISLLKKTPVDTAVHAVQQQFKLDIDELLTVVVGINCIKYEARNIERFELPFQNVFM